MSIGELQSEVKEPLPITLWRRPMVGAAAAFIGGVSLYRSPITSPLVWVVAITAILIAAVHFRHRSRVATALLAIGLAACGLANAQLSAFYYPANHISSFATDTPRLAQLELRIDDPPRVLTNRYETNRPLPPKQVTQATVLRVLTWSGWTPSSGKVLVQITQPHAQLAVGQTVAAIGLLQRPSPSVNPGQFDWSDYYRDQRILSSVTIHRAGNIHILKQPGWWFPDAMRENVRRLLGLGFEPEQSLDHALLRALLLGDSDPELRDVQEEFRKTGTSHHLAISGMHIAVLGGLVWWVCRLLCVPPRWSARIALGFVLFYWMVALPSPPVVRSVLLCIAFGVGLLRRRRNDALQLLALSVLAMLIYKPLDLFNAGFQLSFGTVLGLILFTKPALEFIGRTRDRDLMVAQQAEKRSPGIHMRRWLEASVSTSLAAGFVAWAVSMPLIAYHFGQLNPWSIFAGIVLGPVVFAAMVAGMLKVIFTLAFPAMAANWAWAAAWFAFWMRWTVGKLALLPGGDVATPAPPLLLIALFYVLLYKSFYPSRSTSVRVCTRLLCALSCACMLVLPLRSAIEQKVQPAGEVRLTLLSVGAGQCAVIEPPSHRTILLDAGSDSLSDVNAKCLIPFLRTRSITSIDTILISHANYDHFSGVERLVAGWGVREVLASGGFPDQCHGNGPAQHMLDDLRKLEHPPRTIQPGDDVPLGRDTAFQVLWPAKNAAGFSDNDGSLVVRLTHAGKRILFTGDIENGAFKELLKLPREQLRADVLIAPHHGSSESLTADFVKAVDPQYILSSNDRTLSQKQRNFDDIAARLHKPLYRTNRAGAITVVIGRDGTIRLETFLDEKGQRIK